MPYCSDHCREAHETGAEPFSNRYDFKHFMTGVSVLDSLLPYGVPTNSFVLLAGEEGIRHRGLQTELIWRTLTRGEPAIVLTFVDSPVAVVEHFLTFGWNVLPFLESNDLRIIDCFTSRLRDEHQEPKHQVDWNEHLRGLLDESVAMVRETTNFRAVEDHLHDLIEEIDMMGEGLVVIDSLNEARVQGHESRMDQFIKEIRGDICSRKFIPIFTSTTSDADTGVRDEYGYLFDGIVEMRGNESMIPGVRLKQLSIRKMDGVLYRPYWVTYENTVPGGFSAFDPHSELDTVYGSYARSADRR